MTKTKYTIKLSLIFIATCLFGAVFNLACMTGSKYNARQSILSISSLNLSSQLIDNKTNALSKFYKDLIRRVAEWKVPRGYKFTEAYFKTSSDDINVLSIDSQDSLDVSLKDDVKFTLKLFSEHKKIDCDSTTYIKLNSEKIWEVKNQISVYLKDRKFFYISLAVAAVLVLVLLLIKRGKGTIFTLVLLAAFLALTIVKQFIQPEYYYVLSYLDIASSVSVLLILVSFYFIQSSVLAEYHEMHNMFAYQFRTYVITMISVLLSFFNHNIIINMINWFVWVPILQCYVFQNYEDIIDRQHKKKLAMEDEIAKMVDEFEPLKIDDDDESVQEYSDFHRRRKKNLRPYIMSIYLITFIVSLIVFFKNEHYFNSTRELDQALSRPFEVDGMQILDVEEFEMNEKESLIKFKIIKTERKELIEDISLITSKKVLKAWVQSFTKGVYFDTSLILFKDLSADKKYELFNDENIANLQELNLKLLFIFGSDKIISTAEICVGEDKVSTTLKNLSVITFGLNHNRYHGILIGVNCLLLIAALIFTGGKDKSKLRLSLIIVLLIINVLFFASFFFMIPKFLKGINDHLNVIQGIGGDDELQSFVSSVIKFSWMRKGVTVILFLCIVFIIIYITASVPKEYSSFNKNMTSVKREITSDWKNLRILTYQFTILIIISSIIGHISFGYKYDEFRNGLLSLRYNFIMMFNKFLIEPKPDLKNLLYLYHRFAIFVFYNVVLTGFLATFYFHSCTKRDLWFRKNKNFFVFPKSGDFNFDVNIKATFEEILAFKVFLKAFNSYKDHLKMNHMEHEDYCKKFLETFSQSKQGINKLTFNGDIYVYFERIKRYLLCIVFLRIKINSCNAKIKRLELEKEKIIRNNDNKRDYLIMLQKKLKETKEEIDRFRSTNTILDLLDAKNEDVKQLKPIQNTIKIRKYDPKQLESFLIDPNRIKKMSIQPVEPEYVLSEVPKAQNESQDSKNQTKLPNYGSRYSNELLNLRSIQSIREAELQNSGSSIMKAYIDDGNKDESTVVAEVLNRLESKPKTKTYDENNDNIVKKDNIDESECSAEKQAESENKTQTKMTLKRPEKQEKIKNIDEEVGIFKSNVLKKF